MKEVPVQPPAYTPYCNGAGWDDPQCIRMRNRRQKRAVESKPTSAIHLTNLTAYLPDIDAEIHAVAKKSIIYNPYSPTTMNSLMHAAPWSVMMSYKPRDAILQSRSIITSQIDSAGSGKITHFRQLSALDSIRDHSILQQKCPR